MNISWDYVAGSRSIDPDRNRAGKNIKELREDEGEHEKTKTHD